MAQKGPSFSEWFAARQADAPAGSMAAAPPLPPPAPSVLASLFSAATAGAGATAPSLAAAAADAEKSGGGGSGGSGSSSAAAGVSAGGTLPAAAASAAASLSSLASLVLPGVVRAGQSVGLGGLAPGVPAPVEEWNCGMNAAQRFQAFGLLLVTSLLLYVAAIFVFLPMVIFMPSKFATTFTFASIAWMAAFAILRGPRATLLALVSDKDKRVFTLCYLGSLALTLYTTIFTSSYLLALVAIIVQVSAMMWYTSSSIPGGTAAMARLSSWCLSGLGTSITSYLPVPQ